MGTVSTLEAQPLRNGGFENGSSNWSLRQGWALDCSQSHSGRCSARYETNTGVATPLARQNFQMPHSGFCQLSVWIRTELEDPPFWSDGEPTRTGISVQFWNHTGRGRLVPLDLARQNVRLDGYRGQAGRQGWTKYVGKIPMEEGPWEVKLYMHALRSHVDGRLRKIANAKGKAWVDDVEMISLR